MFSAIIKEVIIKLIIVEVVCSPTALEVVKSHNICRALSSFVIQNLRMKVDQYCYGDTAWHLLLANYAGIVQVLYHSGRMCLQIHSNLSYPRE